MSRLREFLGRAREWQGWQGIDPSDEGGGLVLPGRAVFAYPQGERGWYMDGFRRRNDCSRDWRGWHALSIRLRIPPGRRLDVLLSLYSPHADGDSGQPGEGRNGPGDDRPFAAARIALVGEGWQTATIPITAFDYPRDAPSGLLFVSGLSLAAAFADGEPGDLVLANVALVGGDPLALAADVQSQGADAGETVTYRLHVGNASESAQAVTLVPVRTGWEVMPVAIEPSCFVLPPDGTCEVAARVFVPDRVPPGGRERHIVQVLANGNDAGRIELDTARSTPHPYILFRKDGWDAIREKAETHEWARQGAGKLVSQAEAWNVPMSRHAEDPDQPFVFATVEEHNLVAAAKAWQLTRNPTHAEKVLLFLRRLSDPATGYPATLQGCNQAIVQEGHFFQHIAIAYDLILDSGLVTAEDQAAMARVFRDYITVIDEALTSGHMSNWLVSEFTGAIFCALLLQDFAWIDRFLYGAGGMRAQIENGLMADGWWYECSISYNTWCAAEFTQIALALERWGYDLLDRHWPIGYSTRILVSDDTIEQNKANHYGKPMAKWGPIDKPYVRIRDMWDALVPFLDYRGVMFGVNDSTEMAMAGEWGFRYELAYHAFRDPAYAGIVKLNPERDVVYGVPELPEQTPEIGQGSAKADNVGVAMLRSTQAEPRERIQAVLKYGIHGGYHGHFDRAALISLMRYGRSFYNGEAVWYSYPNYMYAFYVQSSIQHNMVVVDRKQQEPVESARLLWYTGDLMQVAAMETDARWTNPPWGGLDYDWFDGTFADKTWAEGRFFPIPEDEPRYGDVGPYSDRVRQRRLMVVTDDYVVLADDLRARQPHTYENLFQIKGFRSLEALDKGFLRHDEQWDTAPLQADQLVTDCSWWRTQGTAKASFLTLFGPGADHAGTRIHGEDGPLHLDVYSAWPLEQQVMVGTVPEAHNVNRQFWYTVTGDGEILAESRFGAWILGRDDLDLPLHGVKTLVLTTRATFDPGRPKTLFWGNPIVVTTTGEGVPLASLEPMFSGIDTSPLPGRDYQGGPIKLQGRPFAEALPANPEQSDVDGTITVDLSGIDATRFRASVGGDYPVGDEAQRRKTLAFRQDGKAARFLAVVEPWESSPMVEGVAAESPSHLRVRLRDGRVHEISIDGLDGEQPRVTIVESRAGAPLRQESTDGA